MKFILAIIILTGLIFSSSFALASEEDNSWIPECYMDQGLFVEIPGTVGGITLGIPGIVIGLVVVGPVLSIAAPRDDGQFAFGAAVTGVKFFEIGYTIIATPFWLLKKSFYDFPLAIFSGSNSDLTEPNWQGDAPQKFYIFY